MQVCFFSTILRLLLDIYLLLPALYFLVFACIGYSRDQTALQSAHANDEPLIAAAALGPTIFPIAFAAVVGRSLQAIAAWKIERVASIATLEQLLGSRTVISALFLPFSLRILDILTPLLVLLWAISLVGEQSSRRVVSRECSFPMSP